MMRNLESRCIHEGRVVYPSFADLVYIRSMFSHIDFDCLLEINKQICPRFILEFYSQYHLEYSDEGQMLIQFVIQKNFFSYTLEEFVQILGIPHKGACVFIDKWSLDDFQHSVPTRGPYQTDPPCPNEIKNNVQKEWEGPSYVLYNRVMYPLTAQQEQKAQKDYGTERGRHSTSSSSAFDYRSSSHLNDDGDDGNDEGTSRASTPSPTHFTTTPSPITTSSSPSPPNAPSKTPSTKDTSSTFGTTSSSFESKPQSSPPTSNNTPSPQPSNPSLDDVMDAPLRPLHPFLL
ncbi:hypothetical protein Tco_0981005 [Tanacetum coccineum]